MKSIIFGAILLLLPSLQAQTKILKDLKFAEIDGHQLKLDLYLPKIRKPPLVVWVHGGAWRRGSKVSVPIKDLVPQGFAVASVDYRLTPVARFPANVHDIKAAIRWLRARADQYGYDARKVGIAGASAGGHLVNLVGTSNRHPQLEGKVGANTDQSSDVAAIVSFYGAANLMTILHQSTPHGLSVRVPALKLLLGGSPEDRPELAKLASPVFHVDENDPPLLLVHGVQDHQMPVNQSIELYLQYQVKKRPVHFEFIEAGGHGGPQFYDEKRIKMTADFFRKHLR